MTSGSLVSTSNVCSCPTDFAGSPSWTGSASIPRARDTSDAPCFPKRRTRRSGGSAARSPIVLTPYSARADRGLLPDAPQPPDRERREERLLLARRHDDQPVRLPQVRRDLGHQLRPGHADRRGQADLVADLVLDPAGDRRPVAEQRRRARHVQERLVDRDRLDQRRVAPQDRHDIAAGDLVAPPVDRQEHRVRTPAVGLAQRHRRVDAEAARLVARRRTRHPAHPRCPRHRRPRAGRATPGRRAARRPRRRRRGRRGGSSARSRSLSSSRCGTPCR